ncbi:MAG: tRNA-binding protein [SAR324 cluster bacterium]|nr:tRNA-binding protein [SAR324 cluster bacterium]MCZ6533344.1 tRNA-binding protein [SAR324 cluster bacterium]MCZ6556657.1 tRNA-binding protein [SAR324 cluster bacterium]MCZ6627148.1 tRNA-binding protein [SAR324 cluster bacterium]MCZ6646782.1 tRNA-binding protein [SAR324 cluster bacterium]
MSTISYDQFDAVDIRAGKILRVEDFPKARQPAYKIWIDFGDMGEKKSSAKLTKLYRKEQLLGKTVLAVVNFAPLQVADFMSEVLVLGMMVDAETVVLVQPDREVPLGSRLF